LPSASSFFSLEIVDGFCFFFVAINQSFYNYRS
jgi:hypothetical protein